MIPAENEGKRHLALAKSIGWASILALSLLIALVSSRYFSLNPEVFFPEQKTTYSIHTFGLMLHITGAILALIIGPFQFLPKLRKGHFLKFHRLLGRVYLISVLLGGIGGFYMSLFAYGGPPAQLGFFVLAALWLISGFMAYWLIRQKDIEGHKHWMIRNFSLTFAAVTLRLWLPLFQLLGIDFELGYIIIAWLCWIPNLVFAEWMIRRGSSPNHSEIRSI